MASRTVNRLRISRFVLPIFICALTLAHLGGTETTVDAGQRVKNLKPEDIVERAIIAYGSRVGLYTTQKNGILRGQIRFISKDVVTEGRTTVKFLRKPKLDDDLIMLDLELSGSKFILGFDGKQTWSINNGTVQEPSPETVAAFRRSHKHNFETILRYKENDGKLTYISSKPLGPNNELDIVDLELPDGTKTRYEISQRFGRIIYLEYEEKIKGAPDIKYRLYYKDFRVIQNTLVPYEVRVFRDGDVVEERKLVESAFSVQMEESIFKVENALKPAETPVRP